MHKMHKGGFCLDIDMICGLYHYGLTIIEIDNKYHLFDLKTQEIYEEMSIYYMRSLLLKWDRHRKKAFYML